jgi:REP element-mobilizing transposase RayT
MERYRFHADGALFYVTFSVVEWLPVFVSEASCKIVTESLNFCHHRKGLRIYAYVIMPTHLHAIMFHTSFLAEPLERVLTDFRKFTGRQLAEFTNSHLPACFGDTLRAAAGGDREHRVWQPSRHPEQIETERFWQAKLDYLHANPVRKRLVRRADAWRFSSASQWLSVGGMAAVGRPANDVILTGVDW